jgi:hypothetical protein
MGAEGREARMAMIQIENHALTKLTGAFPDLLNDHDVQVGTVVSLVYASHLGRVVGRRLCFRYDQCCLWQDHEDLRWRGQVDP